MSFGRWTRRKFLATATALGLAGAGIAGIDRHGLQVIQLDLLHPQLPPGLDGLKIAFLTDLHIANFYGPELAEAAVRLANRSGAHLALLGGDLVHDWAEPDELAATARAFAGLTAPLGFFGVLGNHDIWAGESGDRVERAMSDAGVPILRNQGRLIEWGGDRLWLAGVDDCWVGRPDLALAMRGVPPGVPTLLLAHEPDWADQAVQHAGEQLLFQLSGHSHGGQVRLPGIGPVALPTGGKKYPMGRYSVGEHGLQLYTSRGIGFTTAPIRYGCPQEVTLVTLRRSTAT